MNLVVSLFMSAVLAFSLPAWMRDAVIENHSRSARVLLVCKDWARSGCASNSPRKYLLPGENSRQEFGWRDTDGYFIPKGYYVLAPASAGQSQRIYGPKWVKVPGKFGFTEVVRLHKRA